MRLRNNPHAFGILQQYPDIAIVKPQLLKGKWHEYFQSKGQPADSSINVELGTGRGRFITTHARNNPSANFIGIDVKDEVILSALEKALPLKLNNAALVLLNIAEIEEAFSPGEIDTLFINFSDPWPKTRHFKRRLTHRLFLEKYKNVLKKGGEVILKTDSRDLFDFSLKEFADCGYEISNVTYDLKSENDPDNVITEYEGRFMRSGVLINRMKARYNG